MLRLLVLAAFATLAFAAFVPSSLHTTVQQKITFNQFVKQYNKQYSTGAERLRRFQIFVANLAYINSFNAAGNASYTLAVNEYADMTNEEFRATMNGFKMPATLPRETVSVFPARPEVTCPSNGAEYTCDWRVAGVVTGVKNQGQCGSCWAFSAVASTEGQHALTTKKLVSLSEQNLVDCSTPEGNQGCNGGLMDQAFEYIIKNKGIDTEASYPYAGTDNKCVFKAANVGATLSSYKNVQAGSEAALQNAIQNVGPISVAIDASESSFQFYSKGVYYSKGCSSTQLDHGVTAVGYGVLGSDKFYVVKNSWGTTWGMAGYILMSRDRSNNCGIATMASYPIAPTL